VPPSASNKLFFLLYFGAVQKVWWRSFVSKISRIFCAPQLLNLVFFHSIEKMKKISSLSHGAYVFRVVLCEWLELFARCFVPVFPPNPDNATDGNHFLWLVAQPGGLPPGFAVHLVSNVSGALYTQCEVTSQNLRSQNDRHFVGILWHNRRRFNAHYSNNIE